LSVKVLLIEVVQSDVAILSPTAVAAAVRVDGQCIDWAEVALDTAKLLLIDLFSQRSGNGKVSF
jgi:hypothetical protein